jgi:hypothetical protein
MTQRTLEGRRWAARTGSDVDVATTVGVAAPADQVRWGPIIAGLVTAITTMLLLTTLALWVGLTAVDATGGGAGALNDASGWVSALIPIISFFVGGWVAGATQGVAGRPAGLINGFLVFASGLLFVLLMAGLGLGSAFGALGTMFGNIQNVDVPNVPQSEIIEAITSGAGITFLALLIGAIAAAVGGAIGAPSADAAADRSVRTVTDQGATGS